MKAPAAVATIYVAFVSLIAFTVWFTGSPWCLWALVLTPSVISKGEDE
jgi:hypothetical protein